jgi:hypothetical protein
VWLWRNEQQNTVLTSNAYQNPRAAAISSAVHTRHEALAWPRAGTTAAEQTVFASLLAEPLLLECLYWRGWVTDSALQPCRRLSRPTAGGCACLAIIGATKHIMLGALRTFMAACGFMLHHCVCHMTPQRLLLCQCSICELIIPGQIELRGQL